MPKTKLSVNINKVALLRNSRDIGIPSVTKAAKICLKSGAHGITIHPRPDARHITPHDVGEISALMKDWKGREYNIEGNPQHNLMQFIKQYRPHQATFVPDDINQATSDKGWDLSNKILCKQLSEWIKECQQLNVRVSLFMDADNQYLEKAAELGADRIELYTEPWAYFFKTSGQKKQEKIYKKAANIATKCKLGVNAGHDLNLKNLKDFLIIAPQTAEVSIGHALIGDALEYGYKKTINKYLNKLI